MRKCLLMTVLSLALVAGACGGGDDERADPTGDDPITTTTAPAGADAGDGASGEAVDASGCLGAAEATAAEEAAGRFPDDPDVTWTVESASLDDEGRAVVEVVPSSDEVGYEAFRLVSSCQGDAPTLLGTYALDGGSWLLLFTTDQPAAADLEPMMP